MATDLHTLSATETAERIRRGDLTPTQAVEHYLDRIAAHNDDLNAYITTAEEYARQRVREAERTDPTSAHTAPLHGVPIAVKDSTAKAGLRTTLGLPAFRDLVPDKSAIAIDRLEQAGAIVLGKTNVPELSARGTTTNQVQGTTPTPFDYSRTAGGSSGGSAAAVAAGLAPVAQGSDGSGSIRIPAAFCGVYGFKASFRRIPIASRPDAFLYHTPFVHIGPITRSVEDAALLLEVMAGPNARDPFSLPDDNTPYIDALNQDIGSLDIAYTPDFGFFPVDDAVRELLNDAVHRFQDAGATVIPVEFSLEYSRDEILEAHKTGYQVRVAEIAMNLDNEHGVDLLDPDVTVSDEIRETIQAGRSVNALEYKRADIIRTAILDAIEDVFDTHEILVSPTTALPPFDKTLTGPQEINGERVDPFNGWFLTFPYNLTGHPAASIPAGRTTNGLPIGMQLAGRKFADDTVLAASATFEDLQPWHHHYTTSMP